MTAADLVGTSLAHYQIVELIGEGGMGAVYRARDTHLDRDVAIKVLPLALVSDPDRVRRFEAESRTASSLNHPHLVAIYDVGPNYIAMELVDGQPLRVMIDRERVPLKKALTYLTQVAEAVSAAHRAGIIHRDLKPENIVISRDGYAKVLDFGLAKLQEPVASVESAATAVKLTEPGMILGTTAYMSPEQAQGLPVDERSDIFSFGCILYECITHRRPFGGVSKVDTLHQIIHTAPKPLADAAPNVPSHLQWIVRKCLAKDPNDRYQTMKDVAIDLRELGSEIDFGVSSPLPPVGQRRLLSWIAAAALAVLVVAAATFLWRPHPAQPGAKSVDIRRLTTVGKVIEAAISPDGKYVSYVIIDEGGQSLWLRQVSGNQAVQIRAPEPVLYWGHSFSPDGDSIYYGLRASETQRHGALYKIATLGGTSTKITEGIDGTVAFSPDGSQITWVRENFPSNAESALMVANADGSAERVVLRLHEPDFLTGIFFSSASWSPDGQWIIAPYRHTGTEARAGIAAVHPDGSGRRDILKSHWGRVGHLAWLPDSKRFLGVAEIERSALRSAQIWSFSFESGEARRVTQDLLDYRIASIARDGASLVTVSAEALTSVWRVPLPSGEPVQITRGKYDGNSGVVAMPDGRVIFSSIDTGQQDLFVSNADGTERHQLLSTNAARYNPSISPDGSLLAFLKPMSASQSSVRTEQSDMQLNVAAIAGGPPRTLAKSHSDPAGFSRDGRSLIYVGGSDGEPRLARISVDGGPSSLLTDYWAVQPVVSPDGAWIACFCQERSADVTQVCVLPVTGGPPVHRFPGTLSITASVAWSASGKSLFTTSFGRANIYEQPLDGSPPRQVTNFRDQLAAIVAPSRDGKTIFLSRFDVVRDAVLITGFE